MFGLRRGDHNLQNQIIMKNVQIYHKISGKCKDIKLKQERMVEINDIFKLGTFDSFNKIMKKLF